MVTMQNCLKLTGISLPILFLFACGSLGGKTGTGVSGSNLVDGSGGGNAVSIANFYPAAGTYSGVPSTVTVNFSSASLDAAGSSSIATYNIICGGSPLAAQSVGFQAGLSSVSVALPSITGLADGTICTFSVSSSLRDGLGNFVTGAHTALYTISSSGGTGGVWNEAASASYTSPVGVANGSYFQGVAAPGLVLSGINVNGGTYVDGISGLWSSGFSSTNTASGPIQGATNESFTQLSCPAGYRMTGIYGRSGSYIDAIGIICKTQDQSQTYNSAVFGGAGGSSFSLSCPAGMFATDLDGTSGGYLDELFLGCR